MAEDVGLIRLSPPRSLIRLVEPFPPLSSLSERLPLVPLLILVVAVPILEFPEANVVQVDDDVVDAPIPEPAVEVLTNIELSSFLLFFF